MALPGRWPPQTADATDQARMGSAELATVRAPVPFAPHTVPRPCLAPGLWHSDAAIKKRSRGLSCQDRTWGACRDIGKLLLC